MSWLPAWADRPDRYRKSNLIIRLLQKRSFQSTEQEDSAFCIDPSNTKRPTQLCGPRAKDRSVFEALRDC